MMKKQADTSTDIPTVANSRNYSVTDVSQARLIAREWLNTLDLSAALKFGLPEIDDRHHIWRVPLVESSPEQRRVGELVIDAWTSIINERKSTEKSVLEARLLKRKPPRPVTQERIDSIRTHSSQLRNTVIISDCRTAMDDIPASSVDLVFTSPPYFNARPEYSEYEEYEDYLYFMRTVVRKAGRILNEGRFFVINSSPVLLRRASRNQSSRRIAVPFDLHRIFMEEGFEFVDDIIWVKPEGAGWATGRGRRFAADRNPLQYKAVPVTEYVMVYRKTSGHLIDWHIRNHPDRAAVERSRIPDGYEKTNIWRINPNTRSGHPAAFPVELADRVVRYYSFEGDVVFDPFAGSGTTGVAASKLGRRFVLCESNVEYAGLIREGVTKSLGKASSDVIWVNFDGASSQGELF
jgi:DNA modification methylase